MFKQGSRTLMALHTPIDYHGLDGICPFVFLLLSVRNLSGFQYRNTRLPNFQVIDSN